MPNVNYGMPTVLVYQALGLEDLLAALPTANALRSRFRDHRVVFAAPTWLHPLLSLAGFHETIPAVPGRPLVWNRAQPALAVNLHGADPTSHRILDALSPRRMVGFACPAVGFTAAPRWRDDEDPVERWARLVEWRLQVPVDRTGAGISAPYDLRPGAAVLHPAGRRAAARFTAVADALSLVGFDVVVSGWRARRDDTIGREAGLPLVSALGGALDLVGLICLVASASIVVTDDVAIDRLARSTRTPAVRADEAGESGVAGDPAALAIEAVNVCRRAQADTIRALRPVP